jgi:branched-chain amino acid transport system ATP-binding protein
MSAAMLEVIGLSAGYGRANVLHDVALEVRPGEIVALIGANGAGKSTLMKTISGLVPVRAGEIRIDGASVAGLSSAKRVALGIAHVPEGRQIFPALTVADNLRLGAYASALDGEAVAARAREICHPFPVLLERLDDMAANLSGGQQQMLAICRGLMSNPRILMLDEPSLGLAPLLVAEIFRIVAELRARNLAILLAEQNARQSLAIADRGHVIEMGRIVMSGPAKELLGNPYLAEKYFGVGASVETADARELSQKIKAQLES